MRVCRMQIGAFRPPLKGVEEVKGQSLEGYPSEVEEAAAMAPQTCISGARFAIYYGVDVLMATRPLAIINLLDIGM